VDPDCSKLLHLNPGYAHFSLFNMFSYSFHFLCASGWSSFPVRIMLIRCADCSFFFFIFSLYNTSNHNDQLKVR